MKSAGVCWSASLGMDKIERGLPTSSAAASLTGNADLAAGSVDKGLAEYLMLPPCFMCDRQSSSRS